MTGFRGRFLLLECSIRKFRIGLLRRVFVLGDEGCCFLRLGLVFEGGFSLLGECRFCFLGVGMECLWGHFV